MDKSLFRRVGQWLHFRSGSEVDIKDYYYNLPSELLSEEQMQRYGATLAESHILTNASTSGFLLQRLNYSEQVLKDTIELLSNAAQAGLHITPADEWLLDNFYLIEEQISLVRSNIPKRYERTLPHLVPQSNHKSYPRVYDIALQIIGHREGHWSLQTLHGFISSYQSIAPLTLGELWVLPMMLRLALIENLSRISLQITENRYGRDLADYWADLMIDVAGTEPQNLVLIIADMVRSEPPMSMDFVAELTRRLQNAELAFPLNWIEQKLAEENLTIAQLVQEENTRQAANQVTVSNCITSLRFLEEVNWPRFIESVSVVEQKLQEDPAGYYPYMDFNTRDQYRHVVEALARRSDCTQLVVATAAVELAGQSKSVTNEIISLKRRHVGYYLLSDGLPLLKNKLAVKPSLLEKIRGRLGRHAFWYYFILNFLVTIIPALFLVNRARNHGVAIPWLVLLFIVVAIVISELELFVVNQILMRLNKPDTLPKMDYSKNIPDSAKTLVVIPSLLKIYLMRKP